ncbi:Smr/MutS family protein [Streptantibioticus parmotrematis]|uniref:Smr/MutS family protein n=1 Tax=Streptantibioticus parmotrematis TaxID=2873249 RepID=UPI0033C80A0F
MLTLDLHPIFRNNRDIELALRQAMFTAVRSRETVVEIIPGKGSGQLMKRVMAFLGQKHIRKMYDHLETDPRNSGRVLVHFVYGEGPAAGGGRG